MKRSITLLTVLLVIAVFVMPSYAKEKEKAASRTPIRFFKSDTFTSVSNAAVTISQTDLQMEEGQLLVVEYFSLYVKIDDITTQITNASISVLPDYDVFFFPAGNPIISGGDTFYSNAQTSRLYVNDEEEIVFYVELTDSTNLQLYGAISGYIIDSNYNSLSP